LYKGKKKKTLFITVNYYCIKKDVAANAEKKVRCHFDNMLTECCSL